MLIEAEAAEEAVAALQAEPRGVVRITCPVTLLHVHVGPMLARFMARYPGLISSLRPPIVGSILLAKVLMWLSACVRVRLMTAIWC
jgi:DNA-binding transcriptional LysR family regulator